MKTAGIIGDVAYVCYEMIVLITRVPIFDTRQHKLCGCTVELRLLELTVLIRPTRKFPRFSEPLPFTIARV